MSKAILVTGILLVVLNILLGLIITAFGAVNVVISTIVIILTALLLLAVNKWIHLKDAFRVSLSLILLAVGLIQYLLSVLMPNHFSDNWLLVLIIILAAAEAVLVIAANSVSNKIR